MSNFTVINDISIEILNRLKQVLSAEGLVRPNEIGIIVSLNQLDYAVNLFLYDICQSISNLNLNNKAQVSLEIKYMILLSDNDNSLIENNYLILGKVIQCFLQKNYIHTGNKILGPDDFPITIHWDNLILEEKVKLLNNKNISPVLFYSVYPVLIDLGSGENDPLVTQIGG